MDRNSSLESLLDEFVAGGPDSGTVPGAAALVAHGGDIDVAGAGEIEPESIVRIASIITQPITAAAVMLLVDEGLVSLDDRSRGGCRSSRRRSRRVPVASSRRSPTGAASDECCWQMATGSSRRYRFA